MDLCSELTSLLQHQDTGLCCLISIKRWVVMEIWKLANPDSLQHVANQFGMAQTTAMLAVHKACKAILQQLGPRMSQFGDPLEAITGLK